MRARTRFAQERLEHIMAVVLAYEWDRLSLPTVIARIQTDLPGASPHAVRVAMREIRVRGYDLRWAERYLLLDARDWKSRSIHMPALPELDAEQQYVKNRIEEYLTVALEEGAVRGRETVLAVIRQYDPQAPQRSANWVLYYLRKRGLATPAGSITRAGYARLLLGP